MRSTGMPEQADRDLTALNSPEQSGISPGLLLAYRETDFRVDAKPPFVLKIGVASTQLTELYLQHNCTCAAFLTASNPYSQDASDAENAAFQHKLSRELTGRGLSFIPGIGQDSQSQRPGETSFLVLGLPLDSATEMGVQHRQNALVWCGADAVPQLILLR